MRVLVILALVLMALYVWPGFALLPAPEPLPPKRVFATKPASQPAQAQGPSPALDPNPECRWSKAMRLDPSVRCKGESEIVAPPPSVQTSERAYIDAAVRNGASRQGVESSLRNFEAALQDPIKRRLVECMGDQVYKVSPPGHKPPGDAECRAIRRRLNLPD